MKEHFLTTALLLLLFSIIIVPITKRLGLSAVLGYLLAGMLLGPSALHLVDDVNSISKLSEFGVVLFMFLIGLELRPSVLSEMKKDIFGFGFFQVLITVCVFFLISWQTTHAVHISIIIGLSFSLSSTALGVQLLQEKNLLKTTAGRSSLAILLFQDIAIVPMMAAVSLLAGPKLAAAPLTLTDFARMFFAIFFTVAMSKYVLKHVFRFIAKSHLKEIFTAVSLLIVMGISLLMESVGLSLAFGSFLAGLLLADSEFRYELEINLEPFKGLLMGLFFMAVGMDMDLGLLSARPTDIIGMAMAVVFVKCSILFLISLFFKLNLVERMIFAITTSQVGEFAFVLFGLAVDAQIINKPSQQLFNLVTVMTMVMTPLLFLIFERYRSKLSVRQGVRQSQESMEPNEVIIAGFGRFGTIVARILHASKISTTILDHDPKQVELVRKFGFKAYYGDVTKLDLLEVAGAKEAKLLIVAIEDMNSAEDVVAKAKQHFPHLKIFVRCRNRNDYFQLRSLGVNFIVRETFSSALEMGQEVLKFLGFGAFESRRVVKHFRMHDEQYLDQSYEYYKSEDALISLAKKARFELERNLENDQKWIKNQKHWSDH